MTVGAVLSGNARLSSRDIGLFCGNIRHLDSDVGIAASRVRSKKLVVSATLFS